MRLRAKTGASSGQQQHGGVIHLRALEPEAANSKRKARSRRRPLSQPGMDTPGLAVQMPESASRQSSSSQEKPRQPQQMGLQLDRLGRLEERDDNDSLAYRYSSEGNSLLASRTRSTKEPQSSGVLPKQTSVVIPEQSPYSAYEFLKSPMNCMNMEQLLNSVNDDVVAPKDPQKEQILFSKSSQRQSLLGKNIAKGNHNLRPEHNNPFREQNYSVAENQSVTGNYSLSGSLGSLSRQFRVPPVDTSQQGSFDIQKSLERQLAELPGAQAYNNNNQVTYGSGRGFQPRSKGSSMGRNLNDSVSVLPTQSIGTSPYSVQSSHSTIKRRQQEQCDTVKIDNGLVCVDPNNLKQQMRKQLRKKERIEPVQSGSIISAADLMIMGNNNKRKGKGIGIKSKLKGIFNNKESKNHVSNISSTENSKPWAGDSRGSSQEGISNSSKNLSHQGPTGQGASNDGASSDQENYNATGVVPQGDNKAGWRGAHHRANTTSSLLSKDLAPVFSEESSKGGIAHAEKPMEVVLPAEGKNPMYKVPNGNGEQGEHQVHDDAINGPMAKMGVAARRRSHIDRLTSLAREHIGTKAKTKNSSAQIVEELGINEPLSPLNHGLNLDGSFCLGNSSLDTVKLGSLNQSLKDILARFAKERGDQSLIENKDEAPTDQLDGNVKGIAVSEKETPRSKEEGLRDAKLLVLNTLKTRIVQELRKKKLREIAKANGGKTDMQDDRRLTDAEIMEAFNQHLLATKHRVNAGAVPGEDNEDSDGESQDGKIAARRKVTFAQGSNLQEMKSSYEDDDDKQEQRKTSKPNAGIMSWANCGTSDDSGESMRDKQSTLTKKGRANEMDNIARKTVGHLSKSSFAKAKARVEQFESACAMPATRCAAPEHSFDDEDEDDGDGDDDYDESSRSSGILSGSTNASNKKSIPTEEENLGLVLSYSGSLFSGKSYATRDTRDTRGDESAYTEGTYDTTDSSYYSYYSRDYRNSRGRASRERHRHRSSRDRRRSSLGRRRGPPSVLSDYTEYTEDSRADGGCRVWD